MSDDRCTSTSDQGLRCTKRAGHKGRHYALRPTGGWGPNEEPRSGVDVRAKEVTFESDVAEYGALDCVGWAWMVQHGTERLSRTRKV